MKSIRTSASIALRADEFVPMMSFGNEAQVHSGRGNVPVGVIALANDARLEGATYSEALTQFTVGYRDPENLLAAVDYIAPPVQVARRFDWKKADESTHFITEIDDERAVGAGFKRVEFSGTEMTSKTRNRGLMYILDRDEDGGATAEEDIVEMLLQRVIRNKYRRAMTALNAISPGTDKVFSAETQPDEIMREALATAQLETGVYPNRGLMGLEAWNYRKAAMAAGDKAGHFAGLSLRPSDFASDLMLEDLRVDKAIFQSTKTAKARHVASNFYGFHARDGLMKDDPSNLKQFWSSTIDGGRRFRVHRKVTGPADKFVEIVVEHYELILVTSTLGFARLNVTNG